MPILRSGPSKEYSDNWGSVFGKKKTAVKTSAKSKKTAGGKKGSKKKN